MTADKQEWSLGAGRHIQEYRTSRIYSFGPFHLERTVSVSCSGCNVTTHTASRPEVLGRFPWAEVRAGCDPEGSTRGQGRCHRTSGPESWVPGVLNGARGSFCLSISVSPWDRPHRGLRGGQRSTPMPREAGGGARETWAADPKPRGLQRASDLLRLRAGPWWQPRAVASGGGPEWWVPCGDPRWLSLLFCPCDSNGGCSQLHHPRPLITASGGPEAEGRGMGPILPAGGG